MRVIIYNTKMHFIIAWTLLFLSVIVVQGKWIENDWKEIIAMMFFISGVPYGSVNDLYDTNYEYDFGDNQVRDEVLITKPLKFSLTLLSL